MPATQRARKRLTASGWSHQLNRPQNTGQQRPLAGHQRRLFALHCALILIDLDYRQDSRRQCNRGRYLVVHTTPSRMHLSVKTPPQFDHVAPTVVAWPNKFFWHMPEGEIVAVSSRVGVAPAAFAATLPSPHGAPAGQPAPHLRPALPPQSFAYQPQLGPSPPRPHPGPRRPPARHGSARAGDQAAAVPSALASADLRLSSWPVPGGRPLRPRPGTCPVASRARGRHVSGRTAPRRAADGQTPRFGWCCARRLRAGPRLAG